MKAEEDKAIEKDVEKAIKDYQCCGCGNMSYPKCYKKEEQGYGCMNHVAGTTLLLGGTLVKIFLGLPKGFNRLGTQAELRPRIFKTQQEQREQFGYGDYNVPVWKYKEKGHVFVRGYMPRQNLGFIHVILDDTGYDGIRCAEVNPTEMD